MVDEPKKEQPSIAQQIKNAVGELANQEYVGQVTALLILTIDKNGDFRAQTVFENIQFLKLLGCLEIAKQQLTNDFQKNAQMPNKKYDE